MTFKGMKESFTSEFMEDLEIKGEEIRIYGFQDSLLCGNFRLMNGNLFKVIDGYPPSCYKYFG